MQFSDFIQYFLNISLFIASIYAGAKVVVGLGTHWEKLRASRATQLLRIEELERQQKAVWKKLDTVTTVFDQRIDRVDRQLGYLAGAANIHIENIKGETTPWEFGGDPEETI